MILSYTYTRRFLGRAQTVWYRIDFLFIRIRGIILSYTYMRRFLGRAQTVWYRFSSYWNWFPLPQVDGEFFFDIFHKLISIVEMSAQLAQLAIYGNHHFLILVCRAASWPLILFWLHPAILRQWTRKFLQVFDFLSLFFWDGPEPYFFQGFWDGPEHWRTGTQLRGQDCFHAYAS